MYPDLRKEESPKSKSLRYYTPQEEASILRESRTFDSISPDRTCRTEKPGNTGQIDFWIPLKNPRALVTDARKHDSGYG